MINLLNIRKKRHAVLDKLVNEGMTPRDAVFKIVHKRIVCVAPNRTYYDAVDNIIFKNEHPITAMFTSTSALQDYGHEVLQHVEDAIAKIPTIVNGVVCRPDQPIIFTNSDGQAYANTFRRPELNDIEPEAHRLVELDAFFDFLASGREEVKQYIFNWCGQMLFHPEQRNQVALLLYGQSQGTGKGTLMSMLTKLVDRANVLKPDNPAQFVTGNFKDALDGKVLLAMDELYSEGNKVANMCKSMVTESHLAVNGKNKDLRTIPLYFSVMATSNNIQPLSLEHGDRRWTCVNVEFPNKDATGEHEQNQAVHRLVVSVAEWVNSNDETMIHKLAWYFRNRMDLSSYSINLPLHTEEKQRILEGSADLSTVAFREVWNDSYNPNKLFVQSTEFFEQDALKKYRYSNVRRSTLLASAGCKPMPKVRLENGKQKLGLHMTPVAVSRIGKDLTEEDVRNAVKAEYRIDF